MPPLQKFINASVEYAMMILRKANADLDLSNFYSSVKITPGTSVNLDALEEEMKWVQ